MTADVPAASRLRLRVAEHLQARANALTDAWLAQLDRRLHVRQARLLPTEAIRDHVPMLLKSLGNSLMLTAPSARLDLLVRVEEYLRLLTELRREQSYSVAEVLQEFDVLAELVFAEVVEEVIDPAPAPAELVDVLSALRTGLAQIGAVAVETYQDASLREKRQLAKRLSEFARSLEHELRGPLQAATSGAEALRHEAVASEPEQRERYIGLIQERLGRISHLVDDIRELAVAESGVMEERRKPIREVVESLIGELRAMAEQRGVRVEISEPLPEIRVDTSRVEVALMSLLNNAIKYSDPGKAERWVKVSLEEVQDQGQRRWHLRVQDNGLGIPRSLKYQIFERRFRARPEVGEGTGMGLTIVREIMQQRGGGVWFESEEGQGTTFVLDLTPRLITPALDEEEGSSDEE